MNKIDFKYHGVKAFWSLFCSFGFFTPIILVFFIKEYDKSLAFSIFLSVAIFLFLIISFKPKLQPDEIIKDKYFPILYGSPLPKLLSFIAALTVILAFPFAGYIFEYIDRNILFGCITVVSFGLLIFSSLNDKENEKIIHHNAEIKDRITEKKQDDNMATITSLIQSYRIEQEEGMQDIKSLIQNLISGNEELKKKVEETSNQTHVYNVFNNNYEQRVGTKNRKLPILKRIKAKPSKSRERTV